MWIAKSTLLNFGFQPEEVPSAASATVGSWPLRLYQHGARNRSSGPRGLIALSPALDGSSAISGPRPPRYRAKNFHPIDDVRVRIDHPVQEAVGDSPLLVLAFERHRLVVEPNDAAAALLVVAADKAHASTYGHFIATEFLRRPPADSRWMSAVIQ